MRLRTIAVLLCAAGCAKQGAAPNESTVRSERSTPLVAPTVPAELAVPEGNPLIAVANAKGVQIYECAADASGAPAWKLRAPRADLTDDSGGAIGSHFGGVDKGMPPGPYWEAKDGSRVHAGKPASVPNAGSIPLLRLEASDTSGTGMFSKVSFVQRLDTTGGVAPTGACEPGKQTEVPYTSKYYFYTK